MPTQADLFVSPAKSRKKLTRTKLRPGSTPTTFAAVTTNLLRKLNTVEDDEDTPAIKITLPDFSQIQPPDGMTARDKKELLDKMAIQYAATYASESARKSSCHVSYKDIDAQHSNDIKPIDVKIKDDADSFLNGLFQFRRAREELRGWESATYIVKHEATSPDIGSDDDSNEEDANKWTPSRIDLFKDFDHINPTKMKTWAQVVWDAKSATLAAKDGQSHEYARKAFSEFIFGSMDSDLQKAIQNAITPSRLWNDGPYIWTMLVHHFFPSPVALKTTLLHKLKTATLSGHNHDLKAYCATLLDMAAVVDTSMHNEELITAFLTQTNTHPSDIVRTHFNHLGLQYYLKRDSKKFSFASILGDADHLHTVTTSPALPFAASTASSSKSQEHIAALAGMLQKQNGHMRKIVTATSQINNRVKQGLASSRNKRNPRNNSRSANGRREDPPFMKTYLLIPPRSKTGTANHGTTVQPAVAGLLPIAPTVSCTMVKRLPSTMVLHPATSVTTRNLLPPSPLLCLRNPKTSKGPVAGLQSLQAELKTQNSSPLFDLVQAAAAGAQ
jgi:hypothetical protein